MWQGPAVTPSLGQVRVTNFHLCLPCVSYWWTFLTDLQKSTQEHFTHFLPVSLTHLRLTICFGGLLHSWFPILLKGCLRLSLSATQRTPCERDGLSHKWPRLWDAAPRFWLSIPGFDLLGRKLGGSHVLLLHSSTMNSCCFLLRTSLESKGFW